MSDRNAAAFMTAVGTIVIQDIPRPEPGPGEILPKVEYVGICGSDAHFFASGERKGKPFDLPFVLGHECSGTVAATGEGVARPAVGDRVTFEPQITCGRCAYCRSGRYNLCPNVVFPSTPPHGGMLRRYAVIPAHLAYPLPDLVDTQTGALIEPLAVGLSAAERGGVGLGTTVAIVGAGCIGLTTLLACRAMGASTIIVSDVQEKRLAKALELGADHALNAGATDVQAAVSALTNGEGADIVFETAGSRQTAASTPGLLRRGGVIVLVGNVNGDTPFPFMDLMYKEGELRTIYRYRNNFQTAIDAVACGRIDVGRIVSHRFPFGETQRAFATCVGNPGDVVKAVIVMEEE
ncbi:MAG: NAD(P)-dependent alcohol dehydrogenase [Planctomycetaceae bacterium]|nr:NAD(P)-dependent alcohol dehydrogenase [Planctomycetaceae bacterium]